MLPRHAARFLRLCAVLTLFPPALLGNVAAAPQRQGAGSALMVYHELTQRLDGSLPIDSPVLSGDGRRAIWSETPADPKQSNRVFALDIDGGQPREIDAYQPLCFCLTSVDVSNDGNTVVSTEGVRIRVLSGGATFSRKRELIRLADDVIDALRISGNGKIVVFLVVRDTTISEPNPLKRGAPIPRGIWAVSAEGGGLIQLAGIREIAAVAGVPVAELEANPDFRPDTWRTGYELDVSDDGRRIIFNARTGTAGEGVFSITEGAPLTKLAGPVDAVYQVAVSGDGQTVALATTDQRGLTVSVSAGGTLKTVPNFDFAFDQREDERLQLSRDGTKLLGKEQLGSVLVDVATLTKRRLVPLAISKSHIFTGGGARYATMNAAGTRVLYVARPHGGNLVVIDLGATELGGAPLVRGFHVVPDTIPVDGSKSASVSAEISWDGSLIEVWREILHAGMPDATFGDSGLVPMQDTVGPDPRRLQGIFAADLVSRDKKAVPGPRNLRLIIESQAADGRRHGTVFDADKTLTVGDAAPSGTLYRSDAGGRTIETVEFDGTPVRLVVDSFAVEIVLSGDAQAGYTVTGRSLTFDVQKVYANGVQKESYTSSGGTGDLTSFPGGAWGRIGFSGQITLQFESLAPQKHDGWTVNFDLALDNNGQLVMCPDIQEQSDAQAEVSRCLATAIVVMQPVVDQPPPPPPVIT
jgi:hypothetical protein